MNIGDRIKEIRKELDKNQEEFGRLIGIGKTAVSKLEKGENSPSDQTVILICKEFNISEEWLRYGTEPMTLPASAKLSTYLGEISAGDDYLIQDIIEVYMELDQNSKDALRTSLDKLAKKRLEREQK